MASARNSLRVVVTGDVTMDWNLARTRRSKGTGAAWNAEDATEAYCERGGAALLGELIEVVATQLGRDGTAEVEVRQVGPPRGTVSPGDRGFHHSYALWSPFEHGGDQSSTRAPAWRVDEFLGLDRGPTEGPATMADWKKVVDDPAEADLVILDDADLGFRDHPDLWPKALDLAGGRQPWMLLKMARPVAQGGLWEHLQRCANRLIVVMTINDLRLTEVQISRELSWERSAQDLVWELLHNPQVNALSRCAYVVVSFDTSGALLLSRPDLAGDGAGEGQEDKEGAEREPAHAAAAQCLLFFDPELIEGMWAEQHPGKMIGYTSCLAAGIARQLLLTPDRPNVERGIQRGLAAMRALHLEGYGERDPEAHRAGLAFPSKLVAAELAREGTPFAVAPVQDPVRLLSQPGAAGDGGVPAAPGKRAPGAGFWRILQDRYPGGLEGVARQTALEGAEVALVGVPLARFCALLTVDRHEIESFRSSRALIGEYSRQVRPKRPLSIAVFGPPGSGKSFGIVQVATSLLSDRIKVLEFNLSQFNDPAELLGALHRVRDEGLAGKLPLVFWDEFDAALDGKALGWLRHFLVPMQDGTFQEGQVTHPVGPAVFVFAGGTSERMEAFASQTGEDFRAAKGPDFVSRLKGYVDVLGPNPGEGSVAADPYYMVRRAILLRSLLRHDARHLFRRENGKEVLGIDSGVLRAFLQTRNYRHGARSLESIVAMSLLSGKTQFERSCLPAEAQLDLHVEARDFLALMQLLQPEGELLERLAEAAHVVYCAGLLEDGYGWGEPSDDYLLRHSPLERFASSRGKQTRVANGRRNPALIGYERLSEHLKGQNRDFVRDIPNKLATAGYVMLAARSDEPRSDFSEEEVERLAEREHERWMTANLEAGWRYGSRRDNARRINPALLPWRRLTDEERQAHYGPHAAHVGAEELPAKEKEKDRDLARGIPEILALAGYTMG